MNGHRGAANGASLPFRPPTVDQALQHSPLTSIVPFAPDTIPFPSASPPSSSTIFSTSESRASAQRALDFLNSEATGRPDTSARLQKTLRDLRRLLDANELTQYNFKGTPPLPTPPPDSPRTTPAANGLLSTSQGPQLSPLAKMVLARTNVAHRYPTPDSPLKPNRENGSTARPLQKAQARNAQPKPHQDAVARNVIAVGQNGTLPSPSSIVSTPQKAPQVVITGLPPSSSRKDYQSFVHLETDDGPLSQKRKRLETNDKVLAVTSNQKQASDKKMNELQYLLDAIFEAENMCDPGGSKALPPEVAKYIAVRSVGYEEVAVLRPDIQDSINSQLRSVLDAGRFSEIPVDDVLKLQKLCKGRVDAIDDSFSTIKSGAGNDEGQDWMFGLEEVEYALGAAKILLKTMTAGRNEKKIYSESIVKSIFNALNHVLEDIIHIAQSRPESPIFSVASRSKQTVAKVSQRGGQVLDLLGDLLASVEVAESAVTSVEDLSRRLIFVKNATTEKDSALGLKKVETIRRVAMDVLAKIFARYEDRRESTLRDILSSLSDLEVRGQNKGQYKMADGKAIQVVSALLMRLVQTSATISTARRSGSKTAVDTIESEDGDGNDTSSSFEERALRKKKRRNKIRSISSMSLAEITQELHDATQVATDQVISHIVNRAKDDTKSSDLPYRNLVDKFTEDLLSVLGSPEWPAAPIFLDKLTYHMRLIISSTDKKSANKKSVHMTMAYDLMGMMASGLVDLQVRMKRNAQKLDRSFSKLSALLAQQGEQLSEHLLEQLSNQLSGTASKVDKAVEEANMIELLDFEGPYRIVLEYLERISQNNDLLSAQGSYVEGWSYSLRKIIGEKTDEENPALITLEQRLRKMIVDPKWLSSEYTFESVSQEDGRLASEIIALQTPFGQLLPTIIGYILHSTVNNSPIIRKGSVKNIERLLDQNPKLLNQRIVLGVLSLTNDGSASVQESAIHLLEKCLNWDPSIELGCLDAIIVRAKESASVKTKKRALIILKDIYLRNEDLKLKSGIATQLLARVQDSDTSVAETACEILKAIWIIPYSDIATAEDVKPRLALQSQVALVTEMVQRQHLGMQILNTLMALLQGPPKNDSKATNVNFRVCKRMVVELFEGVIDNGVLPGRPAQTAILETLAIFAAANSKLFTVEQVMTLQTFTQDVTTNEDLRMLRFAMVIFRHVIPQNATFPDNFLSALLEALFKLVAKMTNQELDECAQCVSILDGLLKENGKRAFGLIRSLIPAVSRTSDEKGLVRRLSILSYFGKYCNLEHRIEDVRRDIRRSVPTANFKTVGELIVNTLLSFTPEKNSPSVRQQALEGVAMMCQSFPSQYARADVNNAFKLVFTNEDMNLKSSLLDQFLDVFAQEEKRSAISAATAVDKSAAKAAEGFNNSLVANEADGIPNRIANNFLDYAIQIALHSTGDIALKATRFVTSSNRQGLIMPGECLATLVALETSPNASISEVAFQEHQNLWKKTSGMEKEHITGVSLAFDYHQDVLGDAKGADVRKSIAKLHYCYEVLCEGELRLRKKFLENLANRLRFQLPTLDSRGSKPRALHYARFCVENIAFFDYMRLDEVIDTMSRMEKIVKNDGIAVAHGIETDILAAHLNAETGQRQEQVSPPLSSFVHDPSTQSILPLADDTSFPNPGVPILADLSHRPFDEMQLRHLTVASMILSMMWETRTLLRSRWVLPRPGEDKKKEQASRASKPTRMPGSTSEKFGHRIEGIMSALDNTDSMFAQCKEFVRLLSVDDDFKINSGDDEDERLMKEVDGYDTPSVDEGDDDAGMPPPSGGGRGRKRKSSLPAGGTPKKRKPGAGRPKGRARKARSGSGSTPDGDGDAWD